MLEHSEELESDDGRAEPGPKDTPSPDLQQVTENEEEEQRAEQPSDGQEHQFSLKQWGKGERVKAAAIVLSASRSGLRGKEFAPYLDSAKVDCASRNRKIRTMRLWVKRNSQNFSRYIYRLKVFGEECEEASGVRVPDDFFRSYGK